MYLDLFGSGDGITRLVIVRSVWRLVPEVFGRESFSHLTDDP